MRIQLRACSCRRIREFGLHCQLGTEDDAHGETQSSEYSFVLCLSLDLHRVQCPNVRLHLFEKRMKKEACKQVTNLVLGSLAIRFLANMFHYFFIEKVGVTYLGY